jgi:hypothetical protein
LQRSSSNIVFIKFSPLASFWRFGKMSKMVA